jgi:16S rRNA (cytidine1402-2'-O)-methyltransferase
LVFYEAPHRVVETLKDMREVLPDRRAEVVRELTKIHEETLRGTWNHIIETLTHCTIAGEYVILVEGWAGAFTIIEEGLREVKQLMSKGMGRKEAVRAVAEQYGLSKKELYDRSLREE